MLSFFPEEQNFAKFFSSGKKICEVFVTEESFDGYNLIICEQKRCVFRYSAHKSVLFFATLYTHMVATADHIQMVATADQD